MEQKVIIASWMSPIKLRRFIECNLALDALFWQLRNMVKMGNVSTLALPLWNNLIQGYGLAVFCLAIACLILGKLASFGEIEKKRVITLFGLGIVNLAYALCMIWR